MLGTRVVSSWARRRAGARRLTTALARIAAALPDELRNRLLDSRLFAPGFHVPEDVVERLGLLREAIDARRKVWLAYRDIDERTHASASCGRWHCRSGARPGR